mmetsp:Transcript_71152/g.189747  ORF Transcript_71152/g.189747 Transcript_71152/m.189747 type:complete len:255 (-) Transcript_71152:525-1289(-)
MGQNRDTRTPCLPPILACFATLRWDQPGPSKGFRHHDLLRGAHNVTISSAPNAIPAAYCSCVQATCVGWKNDARTVCWDRCPRLVVDKLQRGEIQNTPESLTQGDKVAVEPGQHNMDTEATKNSPCSGVLAPRPFCVPTQHCQKQPAHHPPASTELSTRPNPQLLWPQRWAAAGRRHAGTPRLHRCTARFPLQSCNKPAIRSLSPWRPTRQSPPSNPAPAQCATVTTRCTTSHMPPLTPPSSKGRGQSTWADTM